MSRNRRLRGGIQRDCHQQKRHPNSFGAVARAVLRYHVKSIRGDDLTIPMTPEEFGNTSNFAKVYGDVLNRFRGAVTRRTSGLDNSTNELRPELVGSVLEELGSQKSGLDYLKLRALADYLSLSESALLMITRLISIDRRANDPEEAKTAQLEFLEAMSRLGECARLAIDNPDLKLVRIEGENPDSGSDVWIANIHILLDFINAYRSESMDMHDNLMERK